MYMKYVSVDIELARWLAGWYMCGSVSLSLMNSRAKEKHDTFPENVLCRYI